MQEYAGGRHNHQPLGRQAVLPAQSPYRANTGRRYTRDLMICYNTQVIKEEIEDMCSALVGLK